jgi:carbamoyl-phosphate synthase large subunit
LSKDINILFLGGAKRNSLAERFISAGKYLDYSVNIFSYELDKEVPIAGIGKVIVGKKWKDPDLFNDLQQVIRENNIHIALPFVDPAIGILANLKTLMPELLVPVSETDICNIMFDKVLANKWFIQHEIPVPSQEQTFPLIAKPRKGSASQGIVKIYNEADFSNFAANHNTSDYLIQQLIDAEEYTVDCYVSVLSHKALGIVPRKRLEVLGGEVIKSITCKDVQIEAISAKILNSGNFEGPITIQYLKEKSTSRVYVMEINPRFGGGVINSIEAGADYPLLLLKEYLGQSVAPVTDWKSNFLMMRTFKEVFICR